MPARSEAEGRVVYDVSYTTGPHHFRVVPMDAEDADACFLLFGDSSRSASASVTTKPLPRRS